MRPLLSLSLFACLAAFLAVGSAFAADSPPTDAAGPDDKFQADFDRAKEQAKGLFASHQPGAVFLDAAVRMPPEPADPAQKVAWDGLRTILLSAADVQDGCELPCSTPAAASLYLAKIRVIAGGLEITGGALEATRRNYFPDEQPRKKGQRGNGGSTALSGGQEAAAKAVEAQAVAEMLSSPHLPPEMRVELNQKALSIADALGKSRFIDAEGGGVVTLPGGKVARLTPDQIQALNSIPQAQAQFLRTLVTSPPPAPVLTAAEKQERALAAADAAVAQGGGVVGDAYKYWERIAADPETGMLLRGYAKTNMGLLTISGLKAVEESAGRLGYVWDNPDVSGGQKTWMSTKLAGNAALSALFFLPAATMAQSVRAGEGFYWIGRAGAAVPGVAAAEPAVARVMAMTADDIGRVIAETLPQGEKIAAENLPTVFAKLNEYGSRYGVSIVEGGTLGESTAQGGRIFANLGVGGHHEAVHGVQQFYTRVMALEQQAAQAGKAVQALSAAEREVAFARAAAWEGGNYAQLEAQAWRGTGFMGSFPGRAYGANMAVAGSEVSSAMQTGTVLQGAFGPGAQVYGRLTQMLGHSQAEIGRNLLAVSAGVFNVQKDELAPSFDGMVQGLVAPAEPKR